MTQPEALRLAVLGSFRGGLTLGEVQEAEDELNRLIAQRDALLEALKLAWPIIETEKYIQDCSYGKNFVQTKVDRARSAYEKARAAIAAAEGEKQ